MVLKCYFDAGNKDDSSQYDVVTLAAVFGQQIYWAPFEQEWDTVLKKHGAPYVHTTDVVTGNGEFKVWPKKERDNLLEDCVSVIGRHIAVPINGTDRGRFGLLPFTVSVVLKDFLMAREIGESVLPATANEALARQAVGHALMWGKRLRRNSVLSVLF